MSSYKDDVDKNRANRYSSLYHDWFMIGVGCFTYFLVGLSLTLVYVLCEMDYFMLSGLFRIQRFFSDDAYYFSKQVTLIYGVIGFTLTLLIGPIGKVACILWSWVLSLTYLVVGTYSYLFRFTQYGKLLIRSMSIISLITHILMCNFIFFLFDPMNKDKIKANESSDHNGKHSSVIGPYGSLVYYRVIMFLVGFFLGSPIISCVLRISLSVTTFSEKDPIMSSVDLCRIMMLMFSISVMASTFLTLTFSNGLRPVTDYIWFPFSMISYRTFKKTMFNFFDLELLLVVWIVNPLIMTLIPYTTRIHFEFHKFSLVHRLLFAVMMIGIMILMHRDILYSCIRTIKLINASIFNILYTDGYTQICDEHLRKEPVSTTPYSNYTVRTDVSTEPVIVPNEISIPSVVSYPYLENVWDDVENEDKKLLSRSYHMLQSLQRLAHYINTGGDMDIRNIFCDPELSLCKPQIDNSDDISDNNADDPMNATVYILNEYRSELLSMIGSAINRYKHDNVTFSKFDYVLANSLFALFSYFFSGILGNYSSSLLYLSYDNSSNIKSVLNSSIGSIPNMISKFSENLFNDDTQISVSDQSLRFSILVQSVSMLSKNVYDFIWILFSHNLLLEYKITLLRLSEYEYKKCYILNILKPVENCCCVCCYKSGTNRSSQNNSFKDKLKKILSSSALIGLNPYKMLLGHSKSTGSHVCLCLVIKCILTPSIEMSTSCVGYIKSELLSTVERKFEKHFYSTHTINMLKVIYLIIDTLFNLSSLMKKRYLCRCDKSKCCKSGTTCQSNCNVCSTTKVKCCSCPNSKPECKCCCKDDSKQNACCANQGHTTDRSCVCCRCCCICFCKSSNHPYYHYFISLILYLSQLFEDLFTFDNEKIRMTIEYVSNLTSDLKLIEPKDDKNNKPKVTDCSCKCCETSNPPCADKEGKCCCVICSSYKTIYFSICLICQLSHLLSNGKTNTCQQETSKTCQSIQTTTCDPKNCCCTKICENIKQITEKCGSSCQKLCEELQKCINGTTEGCKCGEICKSIKELPKKCEGIITKTNLCSILKMEPNKDQTQTCGNCIKFKITLSCIKMISKISKSLSNQLTCLGIIECAKCCKEEKKEQNCKEVGKCINLNEFLIKNTKNSRISESTHGLLYERNHEFDHINPKYFGYDDVYRPSPQFGSGYFKFVISRVFTVIVLVVLFIFIRTRFDRFVNTDIFGRYLIKVDSNIGRLREVLHNRLSHSVRNIGRMGSLDDLLGDMTEGDVGHNLVFHHPERYQDVIDNMGMADIGHYDAMSDIDTLSDTFTDASFDGGTKAVQESRRRKVGFYILIIVFSLLSALYLNFVVRDLSVMLQLDHTTWSYFISITVLMGMIISLVVKYCVHLYDFVYVLENYSNKLTKIESFVDDSFGGVTGNLTYTSKFVLLFQLLRSMKTDLVSLFSMNYPYQIPAHSLMKNKVYPYKDMTGGMERMMTCENIECIRKMVLDSIGTPESMDLQNVLDFVSYVTVRNTAEFDQYRGYFSGNERYLAWRLGKLLGHNFFLLTYGRYSCMLEMDHRIRKLRIPSAQFLNCQFLWQLFGNYESDLISLKCLGEDSIGIPLTHVQKDVLKNKFAEEYLDEFTRYQDFLIRKLRVKASKCYDSPSCYFPYPELIGGTIDRDKVSRLTREYFGDSSRRLSLSLPTTNCDVTKKVVNGKGAESAGLSVTQFCDHWLDMRLGCCETEDCEKGVRFAHDLIMSKLNGDCDVFESIRDAVASLKLSILNTEETYETPEDIHVPVKSSEHRSLKDYTDKLNEFRYQTTDNYQDTVLDYLNRYMIETMTNREKIMVPLGIFLTWYGIPVCEQHLRNMGKFQYLI